MQREAKMTDVRLKRAFDENNGAGLPLRRRYPFAY